MGNIKDLTGKRFGRLTAIEPVGMERHYALWKCKCDCGNEKAITSGRLLGGHTKSCGCLLKDFNIERNTIHGMSNTRIFNIWRSMKQRCVDPNEKSYKNYGGRGISVCDEWQEFIPFYNWSMNNDYKETLTIDRIDNEGNYSPENCKWSTMKEQANNTRKNVWYEYNGEIKNLTQWSEEIDISYKALCHRLRDRGWSIEKALLTPVRITKQTNKEAK